LQRTGVSRQDTTLLGDLGLMGGGEKAAVVRGSAAPAGWSRTETAAALANVRTRRGGRLDILLGSDVNSGSRHRSALCGEIRAQTESCCTDDVKRTDMRCQMQHQIEI